MLTIYLPIANMEVNGIALLGLGLMVGFLVGLFGVGGGFLMTPMLNILFGIPYNVAVGSDLAQILGTSTSGAIRHRRLGNVDYKLAFLMVLGLVPGVEVGARIIQKLKFIASVDLWGKTITALDLFVPLAYIALLITIGTLIFRESRGARRRPPRGGKVDSRLSRWARSFRLPPLISLPRSQVESISIWILLLVSFFTGLVAGSLGVGGGFIMMPALIYLVGVPTTVAIGTDLLQIVFTAFYGTLTHALKGNVDIILVIPILLGGSIGAQFGAMVTRRLRGANIRYAFSILIWLVAIMLIFKLAMTLLF
ncbi:sulfite exporter TauE/SafE family protein [bacterium]|nr:sulfite exporter TauE/SafE family protein [bacterium]